jgi:hypothetical protein
VVVTAAFGTAISPEFSVGLLLHENSKVKKVISNSRSEVFFMIFI